MTIVVHPGDSLTRRQRLVYVIVLGALTALGPFTIDLYLPSFPSVEAEFLTTEAVVQLTLSATIVGFALGQLVIGPWSDTVGRRVPLIVATAVHVLASIGVAVAPNVELLGALRLLQGIGAAGGGVVAMATVRDLFGGLPLVRMLARLGAVSGLAPILAPVIGSQLLLLFPWRGIFWFLAAYGLVVLTVSAFFIVETLPRERRADAGHSSARERYRALFSDRVFVGAALVAGMTFSGLFAYLSSSSFLFQDVYGLDAQQYGVLFAVNSLGVVTGIQTSSRLARILPPQWILLGAVSGMFLSAATIVTLDAAHAGLWGILVPLWFFICSCGFAFPCQQVLALANHGGEAATAASLMGAVNFGLAGLLSPVVGLFGITNAIPMATMQLCTSTVSLLVIALVIRPRSVPALSR
ncbi:multidrug effflux MFS transporter [Galbitalea sp. SE-J8]|uniref:multidrug effflux MFS transporter n=1 Tax=Galbitalea sp. SE-J8 TaxID=3054952 RepID=UPI00259CCAA6|nr:multidrug effflux MFS transporter [Galbitalea sp. SE-J8]MDM4762507.1 multidrug effflux MFS transporter [Galbitalea sp. SE-J8]